MYGLMFTLPLVGWGMLSAARYPIVLYGSLHLPFILPHNAMLYAVLRKAHTILAYAFFLTFMATFWSGFVSYLGRERWPAEAQWRRGKLGRNRLQRPTRAVSR